MTIGPPVARATIREYSPWGRSSPAVEPGNAGIPQGSCGSICFYGPVPQVSSNGFGGIGGGHGRPECLYLDRQGSHAAASRVRTISKSQLARAHDRRVWGGPTNCGRVPKAQDASPSRVNNRGNVQLNLYANGEASCRSATRLFWPGHPAVSVRCPAFTHIQLAGELTLTARLNHPGYRPAEGVSAAYGSGKLGNPGCLCRGFRLKRSHRGSR